jgi:hypothetical protein
MSTDRSHIQASRRYGKDDKQRRSYRSWSDERLAYCIVLLTSKRKWCMAQGQHSKGLDSNTIKTHNDDGLYR